MQSLIPDTSFQIFNHANGFENILRKRRTTGFLWRNNQSHITPIADTYAYCLMPNHFHLLAEVKGQASRGADILSRGATQSRTPTKDPNLSLRTLSEKAAELY